MTTVLCAAYDTPELLKKDAAYVCDKEDAGPVMRRAIRDAYELGVSCTLLPGNYEINSKSEESDKGAICFYNPAPEMKFYSQNAAGYHVLEGVKPPLGWYGGARITLGKEFYDSLPDNEEFSVFFSDGNSIFGRGLIIRNLVVILPGANKPVIVFDGRFTTTLRYEDTWVSSFDPRGKNLATAEGIPVPNPHSVGFRGCMGSNFCYTSWRNCTAYGFGTGFDIGGEHVYCESLAAIYNIYGYRFDCYKAKDSIRDSDEGKGRGVCAYPVTCINLTDEHNVNLPMFGNASHVGKMTERMGQSVTILGMNLQWPNTAPGYTDRTAPDFLTGRKRATESVPNSWHGSIEYVVDHVPPKGGTVLTEEPYFEEGFGGQIVVRNMQVPIKK